MGSTKVLMSLHVATISMRIRHFDCESLSQLQNCSVTDNACGTWQFCLHNDEPCSFVTFLCVSVATHVTAHGVRVITIKRRIRFGSVRE